MKTHLLGFLLVGCFFSRSTIAQFGAGRAVGSGKDTSVAINGVWRSIANEDFMMIHDGFFSNIRKDALNKWVEVYAGPYTIDDANTITLEVRYCAYPERIGALHTVEYLFKGDTLTMKWGKKLIDPEAGDITAQMPKGEQTQFVRAKR